MANDEIFNALCDLHNNGQTEVDAEIAMTLIEAARLALPSLAICVGLFDPERQTQIIYIENFSKPGK